MEIKRKYVLDFSNEKINEVLFSENNYNDLENKPKINNIELINNRSFEDLGLNSVYSLKSEGIKSIVRNGTTFTVTRADDTTFTFTQQDNDTKNTAGATDSSSKLFIIGATSQTDNPQTYSQDTTYIGTNGHLYSNDKQVVNLSDSQALTNKTYNGYTLGAACAKGVDTSIASGSTSTNVPTSKAVADAIAANITSITNSEIDAIISS